MAEIFLWGLSLNQIVLLVAVILIVIDIFIASDIPTHVAYVLCCIIIALNTDVHPIVQVLVGLLAWFLLITFHYFVWKTLITTIANRFIAPDRYHVGADGLKGKTGIVRVVDGEKMVSVQGDVWPCTGAEHLEDGDKVIILSADNGILTISASASPSTTTSDQ